jgi:hypothetical protein
MEELLGRCLISLPLYQDIQRMAILIHGPPEVVALAVDGEKDFI